ncbi:hypothetical protein [Alteromonas antoniana]|uniref:hypothetical protein n=1 Tax=Alteromonas antoniana TaxID=2803813 RepID=UPI001C48BC15|nr:hypothetical protein [Alteromonas antoniana]
MVYDRKKARGLSELLEDKVDESAVGQNFTLPSPIDGRDLNYKCEVIPGRELTGKIHDYDFNYRSYKMLTEFSVRDILPSIKESGKNSHAAIGVRRDDKILIIMGLRRAKAVEVADADLVIFIFDDLTDDEMTQLAQTSDIYMTPSFCDIAFKICRFQNSLAVEKKLSHRELAKKFKVSLGTVTEGLKLQDYDDGFFKLFPSLDCIKQKFMRDIQRLGGPNVIDQSVISEAQILIHEAVPEFSTDSKELQRQIAVVEDIIKGVLINDNDANVTSYTGPFQEGKLGDGGKVGSVKITKSGPVITIKDRYLDEAKRHKLLEFLNTL